jgi:hypothetical protein
MSVRHVAELTVQHMAFIGWQMWMNEHWTRGILVANSMVTRGPINGRHVSPGRWFKIFAIGRTRPRDLQAGEETWEGPPTGAPPYEPCYIYGFEYI